MDEAEPTNVRTRGCLPVVLGLVCVIFIAITALVLMYWRGPLESPRQVIRGVPIYAGASGVTWSDSSQSGFVASDPGSPGFDEAARLAYRVQAEPAVVVGFYSSWFGSQGWRPSMRGSDWYAVGPGRPTLQLTGYGGPFFDSPWIELRTEWQDDYRAQLETAVSGIGLTDVSITIYRIAVPRSSQIAAPVPTVVPVVPPMVRTSVAPPVPTNRSVFTPTP